MFKIELIVLAPAEVMQAIPDLDKLIPGTRKGITLFCKQDAGQSDVIQTAEAKNDLGCPQHGPECHAFRPFLP